MVWGFKRFMIKFINQTKELALKMNEWLNNDDVKKYAMFDSTFDVELEYYQNLKVDSNSDVNKADLFAVMDDTNLVGYIVLVYYKVNDKTEFTINPIVVNPKYQNMGYGKKIIKYVIDNYTHNIQAIECLIDIDNVFSEKLIKSFGFKMIKEENTFRTYRLLATACCL